jgi:predicted lipid-binding transport protein (Tim44 family)
VAISALGAEMTERIRFVTPVEVLSFLEEQDADAAAREQTVRGYNVQVKYRTVDEAEEGEEESYCGDKFCGP